MGKTIDRCILVVALGLLVGLSLAAPWALDDTNYFLAEFVNHEFLNTLGVIVAITLASAANLHFQFNAIEDALQRTFLDTTRAAVKYSTYWLIGSFLAAIAVVVAKPLAASTSVGESFFNGLSLVILLSDILILVDLSRLVFRVQPTYKIKEFLRDDSDDPPITLNHARKTGQLAEFIRQHSEDIAEDEAFVKLLENMEQGKKHTNQRPISK